MIAAPRSRCIVALRVLVSLMVGLVSIMGTGRLPAAGNQWKGQAAAAPARACSLRTVAQFLVVADLPALPRRASPALLSRMPLAQSRYAALLPTANFSGGTMSASIASRLDKALVSCTNATRRRECSPAPASMGF